MNSILQMVGEAPVGDLFDWDTDPPAVLLQSLARHTSISQSEMDYMVVRRGPATLPLAYRDTYCPECFRIDMLSEAIYFRRAWLDAWTISCPVHGCLLGRFSAYEYKDYAHRVTSFPSGIWAANSERVLREKAVVQCVKLGTVISPGTKRGDRYSSVVKNWFDPEMLQNIVGRDLLMLAGSECTRDLFRDLFGYDRSLNFVWLNSEGKPLGWPDIQHPVGGIDIRIAAAHVAGLIWNCFRATKQSHPYYGHVIASVRGMMKLPWLEGHSRHLIINRWTREEGQRWLDVFCNK